jgi:amino acid transporter
VTLDIMLYGASLMLEFVTLVVLRIKEPSLKREFRVPGGLTGAVLAGVFPLLLLLLSLVEGNHETVLGMNGLLFGALIIVAGFVIYFVTGKLKIRQTKPVIIDTFENLETT